MKHLLVLLVLLVVGYGLWQITPAETRTKALTLITHHGMRLGALVVVLLALLAAAVYLPASNIF